jgi:hypothetical protein
MGMTGLPPGEFSLISPGTKNPGQVTCGERICGKQTTNTGGTGKLNGRLPDLIDKRNCALGSRPDVITRMTKFKIVCSQREDDN